MKKIIQLLHLLLVFSPFVIEGDTIPGPPQNQSIFVAVESELERYIAQTINTLKNPGNGVTNTVTTGEDFPADLTVFDQVWDMRFDQNSCNSFVNPCRSTITSNQQKQLRDFVKQGGGIMLMGDNLRFIGRNLGILDLMSSMTKSPFGESRVSVMNGTNGCCGKIDLQEAIAAESLNVDFTKIAGKQIFTEYPGGVKLTELGGGHAVHVSTSLCDASLPSDTNFTWPQEELGAIGVAFTEESFKDDYNKGKAFVWFDWQSFVDRGITNNNYANKNLVKNIFDFLSSNEIPEIKITATPGSSTFQQEVDVTLTTAPSGTDIYYTLDGSTPDNSSTPYNGAIKIRQTTTLKAVAYKNGYLPGTGKWEYTLENVNNWIKATPGDGTTFHTKKLEITLTAASDSIYYTIDDPDVKKNGKLYTAPFDISGDNIIVYGMAVGHGFDTVTGKWKYKRSYLPKVIIDPPTAIFTEKVTITMSLANGSQWPDAEIYYTLNGNIPTDSDKKYTGPVILTKSDTIIARAFMKDAEPSDTTVGYYYQHSLITSADYQDKNADGRIDFCELTVKGSDEYLPEEIVFTDPFTKNKTTVKKEDIQWENDNSSSFTIESKISPPFPYSGKTNFATEKLGQIIKGPYDKESFSIKDGIAPVIDRALYYPGELIDNNGKTDKDTLVVFFTEKIQKSSYIKPFRFIKSDKKEYILELSLLNSENTLYRYLVEKRPADYFPLLGDSLWIEPKAKISDKNDNVQSNSKNRKVPLQVQPRPLNITVTPYTPFKPGETPIHPFYEKLQSNSPIKKGTIILVDYHTDLSKALKDNQLQCNVEILDPLGNLVIQSDESKTTGTIIRQITSTNKDITRTAVIWTGENSTGRLIGDGTYLIRVTINLPSHYTYKNVHTALIGTKAK